MRKIQLRRLINDGRHFAKTQPLSVNYGIDGLLIMGAMGIAGNNNNLFAQRLGAGDFHLAMLQFIPQMAILLILIPAGLFADSLKNKRRMMTVALFAAGVFFSLAGFSAFLPAFAVYFFLGFLALANLSNMGFYNLAWQAYFPEAVSEEARNTVLTFRARMTMLVQLVVPLVVGTILTSIASDQGKIAAHQLFYILAVALTISNAFHIRKIKAINPAKPKHISWAEMKTAAKRLAGNKQFIIFCATILFFHMMWHMDWTLFFIGQRNYMEMNEFMLSLTPVVGMLAQLVTLKFWSRNNAKQGVEKPLTYGMLGLIASPIAIIVGVSLPANIGPWAFLAIHGVGHLAFANITLNLFQCLLKVVDNENRSFSISVYTCLITLSNAVMPLAGVAVYRGFGGDVNALRITFALLIATRLVAAGFWMLRLRYAGEKVAE
ncbi:MAG: MFS transporter [Defluviitaleaceae bacterium]|nr:MFS transporter [Defluviitaleaceae bacterium]